MISQRHRPIFIGAAIVTAVWLVALAGYAIAKNSRVTGEKVKDYLRETDLSKLSGSKRKKAIDKLAYQLNSLPADERRKARLDKEWNRWFAEMDDKEKGDFIEATMPTGFKQMITAFEEMPPEKRQKAIDDAVKNLRKARDNPQAFAQNGGERPPGPQMNEDLQKKITQIGLKTYYSQSSGQTKAELAPLLEEIQKTMESGKLFRR
jgi:uncharacterized protein HemY